MQRSQLCNHCSGCLWLPPSSLHVKRRRHTCVRQSCRHSWHELLRSQWHDGSAPRCLEVSFLQHSPPLNHSNVPALACALTSCRCDKDSAAELLSHSADVFARDIHDRTPLHIAACSGAADVALLLCKNKADVHAKDKFG